ncbi:MAG TPA: GNAT family N-acetyltransferase [Thermoanaerobaculia bacterium]|jgi:predicted GNAT family acetyltransferase|nr:GNAT family N-acetyltransferase [Thermoanaerobaculia bacterium]
MTYDIRNNEQTSQFETTVDGVTAYAAYELEDPQRIVFTHTIVPEELSGRGIANSLVQHGLEHARSSGLTVVPQCSFVAAYIKRHPEYEDLLAK